MTERIRTGPTSAAEGRVRCPACGESFACGLVAGEAAACWCASLPNVLPTPARGSDCTCLCPTCLESAINAANGRRGPSR